MEHLLTSKTFRLFSQKKPSSFVKSIASILDFSTSETAYHYDASAKDADKNALRADWLQIGEDMRAVLHEQKKTTA